MHRLFVEVLDVGVPEWLLTAAEEWSRPSPRPELRVVVPIWRDPWMVVGARTFTGDVLSRLGLVNLFRDGGERYPRVEPERLQAMGADVVVLPDEPYVFSRDDGPEAFPGLRTVLVSGRELTWYGPSLATARSSLLQQIREA
jgi:hypothetical protein